MLIRWQRATNEYISMRLLQTCYRRVSRLWHYRAAITYDISFRTCGMPHTNIASSPVFIGNKVFLAKTR